MRRDVSGIIRAMFSLDAYNSCWGSRTSSHNPNIRYMEIPITDDVFEVPIMAFNKFVSVVGNNLDMQTEAITIMLNTNDLSPQYKTVDRNMKDVLVERFWDNRLVKINAVPGSEAIATIYYGTQGAVFDKDFNPLFMCSYIMKRCHEGENDVKYRFVRPIVRCAPSVFISKANSVERFLANKVLTTCLQYEVYLPLDYAINNRIIREGHTASVKVEIDNIPFALHQIDTPSVSTCNEQLIQIAIDHLDELIQ